MSELPPELQTKIALLNARMQTVNLALNDLYKDMSTAFQDFTAELNKNQQANKK